MSVAAENMVTIAVRDKDFIRVADALRYEWSIFHSVARVPRPEIQSIFEMLEVGASQSAEELYESNLEALEERYPTLVSPASCGLGRA